MVKSQRKNISKKTGTTGLLKWPLIVYSCSYNINQLAPC